MTLLISCTPIELLIISCTSQPQSDRRETSVYIHNNVRIILPVDAHAAHKRLYHIDSSMPTY